MKRISHEYYANKKSHHLDTGQPHPFTPYCILWKNTGPVLYFSRTSSYFWSSWHGSTSSVYGYSGSIWRGRIHLFQPTSPGCSIDRHHHPDQYILFQYRSTQPLPRRPTSTSAHIYIWSGYTRSALPSGQRWIQYKQSHHGEIESGIKTYCSTWETPQSSGNISSGWPGTPEWSDRTWNIKNDLKKNWTSGSPVSSESISVR